VTREEEDRRLALSTAIASISAASDAIPPIADYRVMPHLAAARAGLSEASRILANDLAALKQKALDEMPKEDR